MQFLTPAFLGLAALAGPIILLYMLRLRRREVPVSSTLLWQRLMQDREANAPWQKLRRNLLLLLQLLILAALVFALARPFIPVPSVASGSVALILDASASMSATDMPGGRTRFEVARDQARALVDDLASDEVMTILTAGPAPDVLSPPSGDRAALRAAIDRAVPSQAPADWESALALAGASIAGRENASIVIFSDGGLPSDLPALPAPVRFVRIGRESGNMSISALAARPLGDSPQLFAAVTNYGTQDGSVILSLEADGQLLKAQRMDVAAGQTSNLTITDLPPTVQVIHAAISLPSQGGVADYLPVDDVADTVYTPPTSGRVLLVSDGNLFLEQILGALPTVQAFRATPEKIPAGPFDLVILDGAVPEKLPDGNLLIIHPPQTTSIFSVDGSFTNTTLLRQADDPILAYVDFGDVAIREAEMVRTTGWAQVLIEAEGGPLLLAGTVDGRRVAILTFDLHASDLPLRIDFPILISNLLQWVSPTLPFDAVDSLHPGDPLMIRPRAATIGYRITLPDGTQQSYPVSEGTLAFAATSQPGVYRVELLENAAVQTSAAFAVNLFAPEESAIAPKDSITIGQTGVAGAADRDQFGQREVWQWLAVAAMIMLIAEWWVYHRGSTLPRIGQKARQTL
jgi:hypothetical protein